MAELKQAVAAVEPAREAWRNAQTARAAAEAAFATSEVKVAEAQALFDRLSGASAVAAQDLHRARSRLAQVALSAYVDGGVSDVVSMIAGGKPADAAGRRVLVEVVSNDRVEVADEYTRAKAAADTRTETAVDLLDKALDGRDSAWIALRDATQRENDARSAIEVAVDLVKSLRTKIQTLWPMTSSDKVDIPIVVLDAYENAADWAHAKLGCSIEWWGIAGTGKVESNHARFMKAQVTPQGDVVPPVRGIALDGTRSAAISDSDNGSLDGDPVWDRAVGPNQFIPQTWRAYASAYDIDGNADGVEDPDNIYDASRATAAMHCRNGAGTSDGSLRRAYLAYNHVSAYADECLRWAHRYRAAGVIDVAIDDTHDVGPVPPEAPPLPDLPVREDPSSLAEGDTTTTEPAAAGNTSTSTATSDAAVSTTTTTG